MKVRTSVVGAVLALVAVDCADRQLGRERRSRRRATSRWRSSRTSASCRTGRSTSSRTRPDQGRQAARYSDARLRDELRGADRIPNLLAAAQAGYNLIFGVGFLNYTALNAVAPRFPNKQFAGIDEPYAPVQQEAEERHGHRLRRAGGRLPRRLPRRLSRSRSRAASRSSARSARTTCRRSCSTSAATSRARRRRTRRSR